MAPPKFVERFVGLFIPPACREEVLGDLHEISEGTLHYLVEAARTVPLVIMSRMRRTADPQIVLMEAFLLYLSFTGAAWVLDHGFLVEPFGLLRLGIPAAIALWTLVLADAYADPRKRSPLRPLFFAAVSALAAILSQSILAAPEAGLALPRRVMLAGCALSVLLISTLRLLFPAPADLPHRAGGPAFWRQRTTEPVRFSGWLFHLVGGLVVLAVIIEMYRLSGR